MEEITIEYLQKLKDENDNSYIKKGWLDDIDNDIFNQVHKDEYSINKCINNCTSPTGKTYKEKVKSIFRAFSLFPIEETQVLILGQDPYTAKSGKADGCAFSVANNKKDASLSNIFKAAKAAFSRNKVFNDIDKKDVENFNYDLKEWATTHKVFLLNASLTFETEKTRNTHIAAWNKFIVNIIERLIAKNSKLVIFLFGIQAQQKFYKIIQYKPQYQSFMAKLTQEEIKKLDNCKLIRKTLELGNIKIFMTSHPSNTGGAIKKGFSEDAPNHFKCCDEFLNKNIWSAFK